MKKATLILLFLNCIFCNAQVSNEIMEFIKPYEEMKYYGELSEDSKKFIEVLNSKATDDELYFLAINGKSNTTKVLSMRILVERKGTKIFDLYFDSFDFKEVIESGSGLTSKFSGYIIFHMMFHTNKINNKRQRVRDFKRFLKFKKPTNQKAIDIMFNLLNRNVTPNNP